MSYLETGSAREKWNAALGVGALHILLGAGLLVGLAVKVAPNRPLEPIIVQLQKPVEPQKVESIPAEQMRLDDIRVTTVEPVIDYREQVTPNDIRVPDLADPLAGESGRAPLDSWTEPRDTRVTAPVKLAATPRMGSVGIRTEDYPEASRRALEEGRVTIRVAIGVDGHVKNCEVVRSSGHERLDRKSCQVAERRWRFSPATEDGAAVASTQERSIIWRLDDLR